MSSFTLSRLVAWSLASVLVLARVVAAQQIPLAEVARREAERRKAMPAATKVLTNKDLPRGPTPAPAVVPVAGEKDAPAAADSPQGERRPAEVAATAPDAGTAKAADPAGAPEQDEAWWRARIVKAREALARDEVLVGALQSRVNALSSDFVARDDPYQRAKLGEDRQKALAEMARMQEEIAALTQSIADIEEEARKASVPPGWLR